MNTTLIGTTHTYREDNNSLVVHQHIFHSFVISRRFDAGARKFTPNFLGKWLDEMLPIRFDISETSPLGYGVTASRNIFRIEVIYCHGKVVGIFRVHHGDPSLARRNVPED